MYRLGAGNLAVPLAQPCLVGIHHQVVDVFPLRALSGVAEDCPRLFQGTHLSLVELANLGG